MRLIRRYVCAARRRSSTRTRHTPRQQPTELVGRQHYDEAGIALVISIYRERLPLAGGGYWRGYRAEVRSLHGGLLSASTNTWCQIAATQARQGARSAVHAYRAPP